MNIIPVNSLPSVSSIEDTDTLVLVRDNGDNTQSAKKIVANQFQGKDAYLVAREQGYTGTREEYTAQCSYVATFGMDYEPTSGEILFTN